MFKGTAWFTSLLINDALGHLVILNQVQFSNWCFSSAEIILMANEPHIQTSVFSSLYHFALLSSYSPFFSKNSCALLGIVTPQIIISCRFQICSSCFGSMWEGWGVERLQSWVTAGIPSLSTTWGTRRVHTWAGSRCRTETCMVCWCASWPRSWAGSQGRTAPPCTRCGSRHCGGSSGLRSPERSVGIAGLLHRKGRVPGWWDPPSACRWLQASGACKGERKKKLFPSLGLCACTHLSKCRYLSLKWDTLGTLYLLWKAVNISRA